MKPHYDCIIGTIVRESFGSGPRVSRIRVIPGYGVVTDCMTTNGDPRYVARIAADRAGIVARHAGIADYALDVLVNGESVADLPFDEIVARILEASGGEGYREKSYDFLHGIKDREVRVLMA